MAGLAAAIHGRIDVVRGLAAAAQEQLGMLRQQYETGRSASDNEEVRAVSRLCELAEEVSFAEATKITALETELVDVDTALERLQIGSASQADLRAQFGPGPLHPVEPCELALVAPDSHEEILTLVAPRAISGQLFHVKRLCPSAAWSWVPDLCILAVNRDGVHILSLQHVCIASFSFSGIRRWNFSATMFSFDVSHPRDSAESTLARAFFDTSRGPEIDAALIQLAKSLMNEEVRHFLA